MAPRQTRRRKTSPGGTVAPATTEPGCGPDLSAAAPPGEETAPISIPLAPKAPDPASLARRKASLIAELKDTETSWIRRHEIYNHLEELADVPILSPEELRRLGA